MAAPVPVLVLGSHITALGVLRLLGRRGIPALRVGRHRDFVSRSRWHRALPGPAETSDPETLAAFLRALELPRAVVLPCSDAWAAAAAGLPAELGDRFPAVVPRADVLAQLVDKAAFAKALRRLGIPHPRTVLVAEGEDPGALEGLDAFVKPSDSQRFFARYRVKAFGLARGEDPQPRLEQVRRDGLEVILQEYVPGPAGAHFFVDGYVDRGGRIAGLLARRRERMYPLDFGNSTALVSIRPDEAPEAVDAVVRLVEGIGLRGVFSVELKRDARDGSFRVIELNPRPWWYVEFAGACGMDVCSLAYRDALGEELPPAGTYEAGRRCVYPTADLRAFLALRRQGDGPGLGPWLRSVLGADQPVWARDDPLPALAHAGGLLARRLPGR